MPRAMRRCVAMAQVLLDNVRTTDVVGRLGGDEMGVLLVQADQAHAEHKAAELAALIEARETIWQGVPIRLTVAYGAYAFARRRQRRRRSSTRPTARCTAPRRR